jgi:hypothetical protein
MKLVLFLLLVRYLLRLIPAAMLGGMLIMEDLDGRSKPDRAGTERFGQEKFPLSPDHR